MIQSETLVKKIKLLNYNGSMVFNPNNFKWISLNKALVSFN